MIFQRCFVQDRIVAYTRADKPDCAFIFEIPGDQPLPADPLDMPDLLEKWNAAATLSGTKRRALCFFSRVTVSPLDGAAAYAAVAVANSVWDRIIYWMGPAPGDPRHTFPNGEQALVSLGQLQLLCRTGDTVQTLTKLDGLGITWDKGKLALAHSPPTKWALWDKSQNVNLAEATSLFIDLERPFRIVKHGEPSSLVDAGAIEVGIPSKVVSRLPLRFVYRRTANSPGPDQFKCEAVLDGSFLSSIEGVDCFFALDPRDEGNHNARTQRSRIEFPHGKAFKTHVTTDKGLAVYLQAPDSPERASALLQFEMTKGRQTQTGWVLSTSSVAFVPHGEFVVAGIEGLPSEAAEIGTYRIITGKSATEYVEVGIGDIMRFEPGHAAVLKVEGDKAPPGTSDGNVIHNGTGFITTSRLTVRRQGNGPADFHTQPERSPAFESTRDSNAPADDVPVTALERKSLAYGQLGTPVPFFPYGGSRVAPALLDDIEAPPAYDYEQVFLATARRSLVNRTGPGLELDPADDLPATAFKPAITPQGIISSYLGADYKELRFGDPSGGTALEEFKLTLTNPGGAGTVVYEAIQRALRAKDLFLVMRKLDTMASAVIQVSPGLKVRDFSFQMGADLKDSVLVLKYFKGKALKDLLPDVSMWACREHLAKNAVWTGSAVEDNNLSKWVHAPDADGKQEIPKPLKAIWDDPDWQGVLLLNLSLPEGGMPNLFEALKPGMAKGGLRLHHLGLNYLPVRDSDLGNADARNGTAFGLMLYDSGGEKLDGPTSSDKPPAPNNAPSPTAETSYGFEVKSLKVEFANSQVSSFDAEVDASFTHLFWDKAEDKAEAGKGHVLPLRGTYESRRNPRGETEDVFSLVTAEPEEVKFANSWLEKFVISRAEFVVTSFDKNRIVSFLGFSGDLLFREPPDFNLFKVEKVSVEKLGLEFDYNTGDTDHPFKCRFRADSIRADVNFGETGKSLLSSLGLKFKSFRMALDKLLSFDRLGYLPLGKWGGPSLEFHFGLDFELDLGFLGKLSGGKGLKLPLLVGWKAGGFDLQNLGLGISFPNWNGKSFEIGIQSFVSIRADSATLKPCKGPDNKPTAFAIVLSKARLVLLGYEWPREADLDLAIFVPIQKGRRMSWALARTDDGSWLRYIAAGHRISLPAGKTTKEVVTNFKNILKNVREKDEHGNEDATNDACSLLPYEADTDAWVIAAEFDLVELVQIWIAACDNPPVYGLRVELLKSGFSADAMYRQLGPEDGVFSAEVSLPDSLRTFQVGIATVRLPKLGLEIFTDGGFKVDLGYPWNNDFSRCFQLEIAIFLGSGGFWFSYTSGLGADWIALPAPMDGYTPPAASDLKQYQAISAGMAMRAGIGRSFEMGILHGEASLTVFSTLEGGIAFRKGDSSRTPVLYGIRGTMGIMLRIWVEVNFIILRATAEFCAYALVGFEIRRVLALKGADHYGLTLPVKVFAEVGIYVHVEIWVTIGCVRVKLFDLEFRGTWYWEETLGGYSADLIHGNGAQALADDAAPIVTKVEWKADYQAFPGKQDLEIFVALLPCVADPADLGISSPSEHQPCVVTQLMLRVNDPNAAPEVMHGFHKLGKFMLGWVMQPAEAADSRIMRKQVKEVRAQLEDQSLWLELMDLVALPDNPLARQFAVSLNRVDPGLEADFAALPGWPGVRWRFNADENGTPGPSPDIQPRQLRVATGLRGGDLCLFVDYLRALTGSLLSETERLIAISDDAAKMPVGITWDELWQQLTKSE